MARPGGYAILTSPGGVREWDTFTCCHCNCVVTIPNRAKAEDCGGFCRRCMKATCGPCADKGTCTPFEKQLEAAERRDRLLRQIGV